MNRDSQPSDEEIRGRRPTRAERRVGQMLAEEIAEWERIAARGVDKSDDDEERDHP